MDYELLHVLYFDTVTIYGNDCILLLCRLWFDIAYQHKSHPYGQDVIVKAVQAMIPSSVSVVSSR